MAVAHGAAEEEAKAMMERLKAAFPQAEEIYFGTISPALVVHTGPGLLGVGIQLLNELNEKSLKFLRDFSFKISLFIEISFSWKTTKIILKISRMCYNSSTKGNFCEKAIAECLGTFILVFWDRNSRSRKWYGRDWNNGIALAFGLTIVAAAYSIGTISGAHLNPAVSIGMWLNKRMTTMELIYYVVGQIVGGLIASFALLSILKGAGKSIENLGQNGVGELSVAGALTVEIILTFILF